VLFAIWNALKDNGIEMPFPQRVVHLRNAGAEAAGA
jgi:small-conductance mechanosensitive channel